MFIQILFIEFFQSELNFRSMLLTFSSNHCFTSFKEKIPVLISYFPPTLMFYNFKDKIGVTNIHFAIKNLKNKIFSIQRWK